MTFGSAAGEKGRVPDGAENAKACRARHKEAEAIEAVADDVAAITERDDGDGGVIDGCQRRFE